MSEHDYTARVVWTGNRGEGTRHYKGYDRTWNVETPGKPVIHCSNDPLLGGNPGLHNPEDMLIAALSACHMLWFLHLASDAGIAVQSYEDDPLAVGETDSAGASRFLRAGGNRPCPSRCAAWAGPCLLLYCALGEFSGELRGALPGSGVSGPGGVGFRLAAWGPARLG